MIPNEKLWSVEALQAVADDLELAFDPTMQDWPYELANDSDIETYLSLYDVETNDEKKFVLMDIIIEANTNQISRKRLDDYWLQTKARLEANYKLHVYQIYQWCAFHELRLADAWTISPYMRVLWEERQQKVKT